jgi:hypothetical protein
VGNSVQQQTSPKFIVEQFHIRLNFFSYSLSYLFGLTAMIAAAAMRLVPRISEAAIGTGNCAGAGGVGVVVGVAC